MNALKSLVFHDFHYIGTRKINEKIKKLLLFFSSIDCFSDFGACVVDRHILYKKKPCNYTFY